MITGFERLLSSPLQTENSEAKSISQHSDQTLSAVLQVREFSATRRSPVIDTVMKLKEQLTANQREAL